MTGLRRVTGTRYPHMVCKFCAHIKTWHPLVGVETGAAWPFLRVDCDCEAWDYGVNVEEAR